MGILIGKDYTYIHISRPQVVCLRKGPLSIFVCQYLYKCLDNTVGMLWLRHNAIYCTHRQIIDYKNPFTHTYFLILLGK